MQILLSKYSGYCYGVQKAVDLTEKSLDEYDKVYSLGSIIHNKNAVKKLTDKGLEIVDDVKKEYKNIIFRSHGVEKKYYELAGQNELNIIDTTCIFVKKIHKIVDEKYNDGYKIIIIGTKTHPEVIGINSFCDYSAQFVEQVEDVCDLKIDDNSQYAVVFQTTFNIEKYEKILEMLEKKIKNIQIFNTICSATKQRQDHALDLACKVDMMVVIGDTSSSNSKKLYELAKTKARSIFIQDVSDLNKDMFLNVEKVGVSAGASTPDFVINEVIDFLKNIGD